MRKFSIQEKIGAGIGAVVLGILYFFGQKIGEVLLNVTYTIPLTSGISLSDFVVGGLIIVGIVVIVLGLHAIRRMPASVTSQSPPETLRFQKRAELPKLSKFISQATQEVNFIGISLETVSLDMDAIGDRLEHGVTVCCIVPHVEDEELIKKIETTHATTKLKEVLERTLLSLQRKRLELPKDEQHRLVIRAYKTIFPTYSMILIDPNTENGQIQVEEHLAGIHADSRRVLLVEKKKQPELFEIYYKSYRYVLKHSFLGV